MRKIDPTFKLNVTLLSTPWPWPMTSVIFRPSHSPHPSTHTFTREHKELHDVMEAAYVKFKFSIPLPAINCASWIQCVRKMRHCAMQCHVTLDVCHINLSMTMHRLVSNHLGETRSPTDYGHPSTTNNQCCECKRPM